MDDNIFDIFSKNEIDSPWLKFKNLNWDNIVNNIDPIFVTSKTILYRSKEYSYHVYIVKKGRVGLYIIGASGNKKIIGVAEEGCIVGEMSIFDNRPNFCTAESITDTFLYKIPKDDFLKKIMKDEIMTINLFNNLVSKIRVLYTQVEYLTFKNATAKIAMVLMCLCKDHSEVIDGEHKINIKFSHNDIAEMTGLSRVTVTNTLIQLENNDIVTKQEGFYYVCDLCKLEKMLQDY